MLLLPFIFTYVFAFPLENAQDETAPYPISVAPIDLNAAIKSTTTLTISKPTATSLHRYYTLPITGEEPDPLGIADVSGFYGPGTWAGWFVTVVAAWWGIVTMSHWKFDPNTWLFLLGMNWAAYDLLHDIRSAGKLKPDSPTYDADVNKMAGSLAAEFNVAFWGLFHADMQYITTIFVFKGRPIRKWRLRTLFLGMILPSLALTLTRYTSPTNKMIIPALYCHDTPADIHGHGYTLGGLAAIQLSSIFMDLAARDIYIFPKKHVTWLRIRRDRILRACGYDFVKWLPIYNCLVIFSLVITFVISVATKNLLWMYPMVPILMPLGIFMLRFSCLLWIICVLGLAMMYGAGAYLSRDIVFSKSCFFMPCAPQSIREEDQKAALFAGLFLFVGWEIVPFIMRKFRERRAAFDGFVEEQLREFTIQNMGGELTATHVEERLKLLRRRGMGSVYAAGVHV
jgi:hypothetical protein